MLGCSTICPKCQHQFACCPPPAQPCCTVAVNRALQSLSGGGLVALAATDPSENRPATDACSSPQISPSVPLAFVLPPLLPINSQQREPPPETEIERLTDTIRALRLSGWYHEGITYQRSGELLKNRCAGTFLVRESSDPRFLFSLSVQTERGPTSVRIHYADGFFRLDAQPHLQSVMPLFPGVLELVQYYVRRNSKHGAQVWVDPKGKWYSAILLVRPLRRDDSAPSLKHLSRMAVHRALQDTHQPRLPLLPPAYTRLELPPSLSVYLAEYPYSI